MPVCVPRAMPSAVPACHRFSRDRPAAPALCAEVACRNATKPEWPVDAMLMKSKTDSRERLGGVGECLTRPQCFTSYFECVSHCTH